MSTIDIDAEQFVREVADRLVRPNEGECLACYENRLLGEFGCDHTLRFARTFRDQRVPRATRLERRLRDGGGFCDCAVMRNVFVPEGRLWSSSRWDTHADGYDYFVQARPPSTMPPCEKVRRGSTKPCTLWEHRHDGIW